MTQDSMKTTAAASNVERRRITAAALLEKWVLDEDGYDDRVWPALEQELKDGSLRCRDANEPGA